MAEAEADRLGRALVEANLAWLRRLPCPAAIVFDRRVELVAADGGVIAGFDPLKGADVPPADETWIWDIAPRGEVDREHAVRHLFAAVDRIKRRNQEKNTGANHWLKRLHPT